MKSDVIVIGAELEALVAALRLSARCKSVRLLMPGAGSLHYSGGGLGVLSQSSTNTKNRNSPPYEAIDKLNDRHPYRILGSHRVRSAFDWFLKWGCEHSAVFDCRYRNVAALTMAGLTVPAFAVPVSLATLESVSGKRTAIVALDGHLDFSPELCAAGLARHGAESTITRMPAPTAGDSVRIAAALDKEALSFFKDLRRSLAVDAEVVILPAILGLHRHDDVMQTARDVLSATVLEIATLPPSVFGLRLYYRLMKAIQDAGIEIHPGVRGLRAKVANGKCESLSDREGQTYQAGSYIAAHGGALIGGLEVNSRGSIIEPVFNFDVYQTHPLKHRDPAGVLDALNQAGVEADQRLRSTIDGKTLGNVHVAGGLMGHWNPVQEMSNEGVAIASGQAAADFALEGLGL